MKLFYCSRASYGPAPCCIVLCSCNFELKVGSQPAKAILNVPTSSSRGRGAVALVREADQSNPFSWMALRSAMLGVRFLLGCSAPVSELVLFPSANQLAISRRSYVWPSAVMNERVEILFSVFRCSILCSVVIRSSSSALGGPQSQSVLSFGVHENDLSWYTTRNQKQDSFLYI